MNKPIILDNAVRRSGNNNKAFEYDYSMDLNVIKMNNSTLAFIDMSISSNELITKTRVDRERDDEEFSLLELNSKTKVNRERDDKDMSFAELESKTFVDRERDDEDEDYINYN